jgi:hypothetical protein
VDSKGQFPDMQGTNPGAGAVALDQKYHDNVKTGNGQYMANGSTFTEDLIITGHQYTLVATDQNNGQQPFVLNPSFSLHIRFTLIKLTGGTTSSGTWGPPPHSSGVQLISQ